MSWVAVIRIVHSSTWRYFKGFFIDLIVLLKWKKLAKQSPPPPGGYDANHNRDKFGVGNAGTLPALFLGLVNVLVSYRFQFRLVLSSGRFPELKYASVSRYYSFLLHRSAR